MKKYLTLLLLASLLLISGCCAVYAMSSNCTMDVPLREALINFSEIIVLFVSLISVFLLLNLSKQKGKLFLTKQSTYFQLLYSILFSNGILNPKLYAEAVRA